MVDQREGEGEIVSAIPSKARSLQEKLKPCPPSGGELDGVEAGGARALIVSSG
jgi:hypothetical protein